LSAIIIYTNITTAVTEQHVPENKLASNIRTKYNKGIKF